MIIKINKIKKIPITYFNKIIILMNFNKINNNNIYIQKINNLKYK